MSEHWLLGSAFLGASLVIPGVALYLLWPSTTDDEGASSERAMVALAVPVALLIVASELLARAGLLRVLAVWCYAMLTVAVSIGAVAWQRERARARLASLRGVGQAARRVGALPLVLAAALIQVSLVLRRTDSLIAPTPWYYWQQSIAIARAGEVPSLAHEWGTVVGFFDYHLGFNTFGAVFAVATGTTSELFGAQVLRVLAAIGTVLGAWLFARAWGAPRYAAVATAFAVPCVSIIAIKLSSYRPESASYMLLLLTAGLVLRWFRHGGHLLLAATVVSFVGVTQIHTPAATVALALCAATAMVHFRRSWRWVAGAVAVGLTLIVAWFAVDTITGHRGPFASGFADPPELSATGRDPTYEFSQLATASPPADPEDLGRNPPSPSTMLDRSLTGGFLVGDDRLYWGFVGAVGLVALVAVARRRWAAARFFLMLSLFLGLVLTLAILGSVGWSTYVPRRTGFSRLVQFWWFVPLAGIPLAATLTDRARLRVTISVLVLLAGGAIWVRATDPTKALQQTQPSEATLSAVRALQLEPNAIVLTNTYSQGFVEYNTPGLGLLDGRAPYLERGLLARANRILRRMAAFFADPAANPFPFAHYRVRYVLVATEPNALGNPTTYAADPAQLAKVPGLKLVSEGPGILLYRVTA